MRESAYAFKKPSKQTGCCITQCNPVIIHLCLKFDWLITVPSCHRPSDLLDFKQLLSSLSTDGLKPLKSDLSIWTSLIPSCSDLTRWPGVFEIEISWTENGKDDSNSNGSTMRKWHADDKKMYIKILDLWEMWIRIEYLFKRSVFSGNNNQVLV